MLGHWDPYSFQDQLNCCKLRTVDDGGGGGSGGGDDDDDDDDTVLLLNLKFVENVLFPYIMCIHSQPCVATVALHT